MVFKITYIYAERVTIQRYDDGMALAKDHGLGFLLYPVFTGRILLRTLHHSALLLPGLDWRHASMSIVED